MPIKIRSRKKILYWTLVAPKCIDWRKMTASSKKSILQFAQDKKGFFLWITLLQTKNIFKYINVKYTKIRAKWSNQKFWLWHFPYFPPSLLVGPPAEGHTEAGGGRLTPAGLNQTSAGPYSCIYYSFYTFFYFLVFFVSQYNKHISTD